ncbi:hypothetical protein ElyMa_002990400 [Elysia marginata]|uniref:Uncharacterized protein n=1 Tax=Elysia marginata TaxID=1093978 RepID=A0AAV4IAM3_9GAST|nr:hypothetical protein ElyMa_002990400 [Elysia marginata]
MASGSSAKTTAQVITIDRARTDNNASSNNNTSGAHNTSSSNISPWMVAEQKKVERKVTLTTEFKYLNLQQQPMQCSTKCLATSPNES